MFFFKHETAYEMRISDWSSDVCSSDLAACPSSSVLSRCVLGHRLLAQREIDDLSEVQCVAAAALADLLATRKAIGDDHGDRKSVGSGKCVSLRVDLVGRRNIINKNT